MFDPALQAFGYRHGMQEPSLPNSAASFLSFGWSAPLKQSTNWDGPFPIRDGPRDGWKARKNGRCFAEAAAGRSLTLEGEHATLCLNELKTAFIVCPKSL